MAPYGPIWLQMGPDGPTWPEMGQMIPDGPIWPHMVPDGLRRPQSSAICPVPSVHARLDLRCRTRAHWWPTRGLCILRCMPAADTIEAVVGHGPRAGAHAAGNLDTIWGALILWTWTEILGRVARAFGRPDWRLVLALALAGEARWR